MQLNKRLFMISIIVVLMFTAIWIVDLSLNREVEGARENNIETQMRPSIPVEEGVFKRSSLAMEYSGVEQIASHRTLNDYYQNRAYEGAPPTIPHAVLNPEGIGGNDCLQCHENGGFVNAFGAYAPVTPHPEKLNCKQCHVPQMTTELFVGTNWKKTFPAQYKIQALEGSPPIIPHTLQMRENCLSCHAGPAAPKEIRVTHPERVNCRQCHAQVEILTENLEGWSREEVQK